MKQNAKNVPLVKQNVMKLEVFILGRQRIDQKRKKGWGTEAETASQKWEGAKKMLKFTIIFHKLKLCSLLFTHNCTYTIHYMSVKIIIIFSACKSQFSISYYG